MRVIIKKVGEEAKVAHIDGDLESMQAVVGGRIERVPYWPGQGIDCWVNEEGMLIGLAPNIRGLCGDILFTNGVEGACLTDGHVAVLGC